MKRASFLTIILIACDGENMPSDAGHDAGAIEIDAGEDSAVPLPDGGSDAGNDGGPDAGMDDAGPLRSLGDPCTSSAQCGEGAVPTCWTEFFGNNPAFLETPDGYCSSRCSEDAECGTGVCVNFGGTIGRWCLAGCTAATECRGPDYACVFGSLGDDYCMPSTIFDCDPTTGEGACSTGGPSGDLPGGCVRGGHGAGMRGYCEALCNIGVDTCEPDGALRVRHCLVTDARWDASGAATGDTFVGPHCVVTGIAESSADPVGTECSFMSEIRFELCVDGAECYLTGAAPAGMGFDSAGDNLCYQLCYLPGGASTIACPASTACTDVWGLGARTDPVLRVGMCQ